MTHTGVVVAIVMLGSAVREHCREDVFCYGGSKYPDSGRNAALKQVKQAMTVVQAGSTYLSAIVAVG